MLSRGADSVKCPLTREFTPNNGLGNPYTDSVITESVSSAACHSKRYLGSCGVQQLQITLFGLRTAVMFVIWSLLGRYWDALQVQITFTCKHLSSGDSVNYRVLLQDYRVISPDHKHITELKDPCGVYAHAWK